MSEGIAWTSIITGLITATATLLGVWLTQRHARRVRLLDRHDERLIEQREALVEVLAAGREWTASQEAVAMVAAELTTDALTETWVFQRHNPLDLAHSRALLTARLVTRDPEVRAALDRLSALADKLPPCIGDVIEARKRGVGADAQVALARANGRFAHYGQALDGLERLTRERVVNDPPAELRRGLWHWLRPSRS